MTASGCDMVNSIKEYFAGSEETKAPAKQAVQKQPAAQPQAQPAPAPMTAKTLARVGSWSISVDEFEERLTALKEIVPDYDVKDPEARRLILDELVNQQVMVAAAKEKGVDRQKDVQDAIKEFRRTVLVRELARQLTQEIQVSDADARAFYTENQEMMVGLSEWHVREIVAPTKDEATNILTKVLQGADFAETARMRSTGSTAAQGGDLGFITQEPFPAMGTALLPLEEGDVSSVFRGPDGFYIVKLEEKKGGEPIAFEDIKEDIIQSQTLLMQQQALLGYLEKIKAQMDIQINENLL